MSKKYSSAFTTETHLSSWHIVSAIWIQSWNLFSVISNLVMSVWKISILFNKFVAQIESDRKLIFMRTSSPLYVFRRKKWCTNIARTKKWCTNIHAPISAILNDFFLAKSRGRFLSSQWAFYECDWLGAQWRYLELALYWAYNFPQL